MVIIFNCCYMFQFDSLGNVGEFGVLESKYTLEKIKFINILIPDSHMPVSPTPSSQF